jgi:hypothetical protein
MSADFALDRLLLDFAFLSVSVRVEEVRGVRSRPWRSPDDFLDAVLLCSSFFRCEEEDATDDLEEVERRNDPRRKPPSLDSFVLLEGDENFFMASVLHAPK